MLVVAAAAAAALLLPATAFAAPYTDAFTQQAAFPDITSPAGTTASATASRLTGAVSVDVAARSAQPVGTVVPYANVGVGGASAAASAVIVHRISTSPGTYTTTVTTTIDSKAASAVATGTVVPYNTAAGSGVGLYAIYQAYDCSSSGGYGGGTVYCYGVGPYDSTYVPIVCAPIACADPGATITMSKPVTVPAGADGIQLVVYLNGNAATQGQAQASASTSGTVTSITAA